VSFGRAVAEIVFDARGFSREIAGVPPGLARVLDRQMREMLARLPDGDALMTRVHRAVATTLHGSARPSLQSTARALKASPRTVQRWLGEYGTSHREVVNAVRRDLAVRFLGVRRMSITEIAFLLGFNDVSGFRRTFKRWTGKTPSSFRAAA
jgi:AraC-like DNA-binding protein